MVRSCHLYMIVYECFHLRIDPGSIPRLRVDRNPSRYTARKAPHKPILFLALIILDRNQKIHLSNIKPSIDLRKTMEDPRGSIPKKGTMEASIEFGIEKYLASVHSIHDLFGNVLQFREYRPDVPEYVLISQSFNEHPALV